MSEVIGSGTIKVTADNRDLKAGLEEAKRAVRGFGDDLGNSTQAGATRAQASIQKYVDRLKLTADNAGKTASELKLMDLAQRGASQTQLAAAAAALKTIDAYKAQQAELRRVASAAQSASREQAAAASAQNQLFDSLKDAVRGVSVAVLVNEFIQAADAMASLEARVRLAAGSMADFQRAQTKLVAIAQESRTGLAQTADLFTSLTRSTEALGVSQDDVLGVTRTINQALVVSGASAEGAAAALVQLGQGFASGTLRGEELNSVLEQAPRLARAIADGLGVTVGQLRQLGQDGKLTAEQVFQAIQKGGKAINDEFSRVPLTVGQATTQAKNALQVLVGALDGATGATGSLAQSISSVAQSVIDLAAEIRRGAEGSKDIGLLAEAFLTVSETVRVLYAQVAFVFSGIGREIGAIAAQMVALARLDFNGFSAISDAVREDAKAARAEVDRVTADILTRRPNALEMQRRVEDRGFDPLKRAGGGALASDDKKSGKTDPYASALESLRERIGLLGKEGELEKVNAEIEAGRFGKLTEQRRLALQYAAIQIDQYNEEQAQLKGVETARDAATQALSRASTAALQGLATYEAGNRSLQEEIEMLGADAKARAVIENARLQALITTKETQLAERELSGVGDERNQVLQREIDLLKERQQLNMGKAIKETEIQTREIADRAKSTLAESIEDGILNGFRDSKSIARVFLDELKAQFARTYLRPVIQPVVQGLQDAAGGLLGDLLGGLMGTLKGGSGIGITNDVTGSLVSLGLGGGRQAGGPVYPNTLHPVTEDGRPELLDIGGKRYLMTGDQGGWVTSHEDSMRAVRGAVTAQGSATAQAVKLSMPAINVINNTGTPAKASVQQREDGGLDVLLEAMESSMADRVANGQGPLHGAISGRFGLRPSFSS